MSTNKDNFIHRTVTSMVPDKPLMADTLYNSLWAGLLAAGVVGAYRVIKHRNNVEDLAAADKKSGTLESQMSTTFEPELGKKASDNSSLSSGNVLYYALPAASALLAAGLTYGAVDNWATQRRTSLLKDSIERKDKAVQDLMRVRARIAKGTATDAEVQKALSRANQSKLYVQDKDLLGKKASTERGMIQNKELLGKKAAVERGMLQKGVSMAALVPAAVLVASAVASKEYFDAVNENNLRFKAMKKGLHAYARSKTEHSPITINPRNSSSFFSSIDEGSAAPTVRQEPSVDEQVTAKPISMTI